MVNCVSRYCIFKIIGCENNKHVYDSLYVVFHNQHYQFLRQAKPSGKINVIQRQANGYFIIISFRNATPLINLILFNVLLRELSLMTRHLCLEFSSGNVWICSRIWRHFLSYYCHKYLQSADRTVAVKDNMRQEARLLRESIKWMYKLGFATF